MPIDVLAERLATTRGALYKTLHDAAQARESRRPPTGGNTIEQQRDGPLERPLGPRGPEVACDECFELLDGTSTSRSAGVEADQLFPGLPDHLAGARRAVRSTRACASWRLLTNGGLARAERLVSLADGLLEAGLRRALLERVALRRVAGDAVEDHAERLRRRAGPATRPPGSAAASSSRAG